MPLYNNEKNLCLAFEYFEKRENFGNGFLFFFFRTHRSIQAYKNKFITWIRRNQKLVLLLLGGLHFQ
jgi:hypothetical protein